MNIIDPWIRSTETAMVIIASVSALGGPAVVAGKPYEVRGTVELLGGPSTNSPGPKVIQSQPFRVFVKGARWQIQIWQSSNSLFTIGCDGTDIFELLQDAGSRKVGVQPGQIWPGTSPTNEFDYAKFLWFACASGDYFKAGAAGTRSFAPWTAPAGVDVSDGIYSMRAVWSKHEPRLPVRASFLVSRRLLERARPRIRARSNWRSRLDLLSRYRPGSLGGVFYVGCRTNVEGLRLPLRFSCWWNGPSTGVVATLTGLVSNITARALACYAPPMHTNAYVVDFRFADPRYKVSAISYPVANGHWPDAHDPKLVKLFNEQRTLRGRLRSMDFSRAFILTLLGLIVGMPIWLAYKSARNKRTKAT
jgi:hypothetical protein